MFRRNPVLTVVEFSMVELHPDEFGAAPRFSISVHQKTKGIGARRPRFGFTHPGVTALAIVVVPSTVVDPRPYVVDCEALEDVERVEALAAVDDDEPFDFLPIVAK